MSLGGESCQEKDDFVPYTLDFFWFPSHSAVIIVAAYALYWQPFSVPWCKIETQMKGM